MSGPYGAAVARRWLSPPEVAALRAARLTGSVVELLAEHRAARVTWQELGDAMGVTRQRAHQLGQQEQP